MNVDQKLNGIRDLVQEDVGDRGLARNPHDNLLTATKSDFANACVSIAYQANPWLAIVTGFFIPTANPPAGETDGPLGAIFLARACAALGIRSAIVTDPFCMTAIDAGLSACEINGTTGLWQMPERITPDFEARFAFVSHRIAIERVGPAADGRCYTMRGRDISESMRPAQHLFERTAVSRPAVVSTKFGSFDKFISIGIGDGGNEIGMGKISHDTIRSNIPNGDTTHCRIATDHLVVTGVSNWGGYALAAGVALLRGAKLPDQLFDPERERQLLQLMVDHGPLVDGVSGKATATVDGLSWDDYVRPLIEIRNIVKR
jgi:hypothetical protein